MWKPQLTATIPIEGWSENNKWGAGAEREGGGEASIIQSLLINTLAWERCNKDDDIYCPNATGKALVWISHQDYPSSEGRQG